MKLKRMLFVLAVFLFQHSISAQSNIGLKFFGLSIHPKGEKANAFLMPNKLDQNGYLVLNMGAMVSFEHFFHHDVFSVKIVQALYADCAARTGGFSHIGLRGRIFQFGKHALSGGVGPTLVYRRNWLQLEGYKNPHRFKGGEHDQWQYLFLWYGGEFEYTCQINERLKSAITFVPGFPDLMSLSVGVIYQLPAKK